MQTILITGNIGRDAALRQAGGNDVCSFSVGVRQGFGDRATSNWFRCNVWGKRGTSIVDYLRKGVRVTVQGELTIGEYDGKPQYDIRVNEVEWDRQNAGTRDDRDQGGRGSQPRQQADLDDDCPF